MCRDFYERIVGLVERDNSKQIEEGRRFVDNCLKNRIKSKLQELIDRGYRDIQFVEGTYVFDKDKKTPVRVFHGVYAIFARREDYFLSSDFSSLGFPANSE